MTDNNNRLKIKTENNQLTFYNPNDEENDYLIVTFHRTLRIPDDDNIYPLPPSLGSFPIKRVDDYLNKVPEHWKEHGGVFIPLYQREALWLEFLNLSEQHPHALKVAVGKVNALSGESWDESLKEREVQDYCITPLQPWLDGINAGDGYIKQFVAMPLGSGYSVEKQVTGEEKVGGVQLVCYKANEEKRKEKFKPVIVNKERKLVQQNQSVGFSGFSFGGGGFGSSNNNNNNFDFFSGSIPTTTTTTTATSSMKYTSFPPPPPSSVNSCYSSMVAPPPMMECKGFSAPPPPTTTTSFAPMSTMSSSISPTTFNNNEVECSVQCCSDNLFDAMEESYSRESFVLSSSSSLTEERREVIEAPKAKELSLAAGGKMKQQIIQDPYGVSFWDETSKARVFIHIINSEMYKQITGENPPETPISAETYTSYGYPWFDTYNENVGSVGKSNILGNVKSIKEIDQEKHLYPQQDDSTVNISNVHVIKNDIRDGDW
ncbi:hypothetical protein ABK040_016677 [Willaertia magna]